MLKVAHTMLKVACMLLFFSSGCAAQIHEQESNSALGYYSDNFFSGYLGLTVKERVGYASHFQSSCSGCAAQTATRAGV
jgi:hypothetical protein